MNEDLIMEEIGENINKDLFLLFVDVIKSKRQHYGKTMLKEFSNIYQVYSKMNKKEN